MMIISKLGNPDKIYKMRQLSLISIGKNIPIPCTLQEQVPAHSKKEESLNLNQLKKIRSRSLDLKGPVVALNLIRFL